MRAPVTVIAYHAVGSCPPEDDPHNLWVGADAFAAQMAFLDRRRHVVDLGAVVAGQVPAGRPAVAITFDDAYRCVLTEALPILRRHGFPATVFVPSGFVGDRNRWDEPSPCPLEVMSADELREADTGGLSVESHGHGHVDLGAASADEARADLAVARQELEMILGRPPRYLAYPFGDGSPSSRQVAAELGFDAAFSIDRRSAGPYSRGRVQVTPLDGPRLFALKTSGTYLALRHSRVFSAGWSLATKLAGRVHAR